jgi:deoxyribodipyrimidine photolyase-related protein
MRHLVVILGDQLNSDSAAFDGFDGGQDALWMAEVRAESTHVPSSKVRTALFLSAMRHFHAAQQTLGRTVHYRALPTQKRIVASGTKTKTQTEDTLGAALAADLIKLQPQAVVLVQPGDFRVLQQIRAACGATSLVVREDRHFLCSLPDFAAWAAPRK